MDFVTDDSYSPLLPPSLFSPSLSPSVFLYSMLIMADSKYDRGKMHDRVLLYRDKYCDEGENQPCESYLEEEF